MKKNNLIVTIIVFLFGNLVFSQNNTCNNAKFLCLNNNGQRTFSLPTNVGIAELGPQYGCLIEQPNPSWFYMIVDQPGDIIISLSTNPAIEVDFVCWGPFTSQTTPCSGGLTSACTSCPSNLSNPSFYPSGNMVDCDYSFAAVPTVNIRYSVHGQIYILMVTNFYNNPSNITFTQTNSPVVGSGRLSCDSLQVSIDYPNVVISKMDEMQIIPNPNNGFFSITLPDNFSDSEITISDIMGRLIYVQNNISQRLDINLSNQSKGVYLVKCKTFDKVIMSKLIIQR